MKVHFEAVREADVVVIGAGVAGLSVARGLDGLRVDLLARGPLGQSGSSPWAQGGIAGAVGAGDCRRSTRGHARRGGEIATPRPWRA